MLFAALAAATLATAPVHAAASAKPVLGYLPSAQRPAVFASMEDHYPTARVGRGTRIHPLPRAAVPFEVHYRSAAGKPMDTARFMAANRVSGLLLIQDGKILTERYAMGFSPAKRWTSFSVAKSVTSTLVGAAIRDGAIGSVDDQVAAYIPELKGSAFDGVTIRHLLTMSSGVRWNEDYEDPKSDFARLYDSDLVPLMAGTRREAEPGAKFFYNTGCTGLLGEIVRRATGKPLATYLSEKIWAPFGMERDAAWLTVRDKETAGINLSMTLHDYARFGLFILGGGMVDGKPVLPDGWIADATTYRIATGWGDVGYGYQWWVNRDGTYMALGIYGQTIFVDPARKLVIVMLSAWEKADTDPTYVTERAYLAAVRAAVK